MNDHSILCSLNGSERSCSYAAAAAAAGITELIVKAEMSYLAARQAAAKHIPAVLMRERDRERVRALCVCLYT